ncbi:MAG: helix-turn-helix domain-containing protein [Candidatus Syntropharchaeia archaeon]
MTSYHILHGQQEVCGQTHHRRQRIPAKLRIKGKRSAREFQRAWILLLADKGKTDREISELLNVSRRTVERIRTRYVNEGLDAIHDKPRPGQPKKLSSSQYINRTHQDPAEET